MGTSKGKKKIKEKVEGGADEAAKNELDLRIELLKNLGLSITKLKTNINELKKARKDRKEKEIKKAEEALEKKVGELWELWEQKRLSLSWKFVEAGEAICTENGIKSKKLTDLRKKADESIERKDPKRSTEILEELRGEFEGAFSKFPGITLVEAWSSMDKALDAYIDVAGTESKLDKAKKYFKRTLKLIENGDIDKSLVYSNLLYTTIQSEMSEDLAKDRFKTFKDEIGKLMTTMEEFKEYGIEPEGMEKELKKLGSGIEASKFGEAQSTINRLNKNVSRVEKEFFRRKGTVNLLEASDLIGEYGSLIDLKEPGKKISNIKVDQTKMSPRKFMEESGSILNDVKLTLFDNFEGQVRERIVVLDESMEQLPPSDDSEMLAGLRQNIGKALQNKDIQEAMEYLSMAESTIGQSEGSNQLVSVRDNYLEFLSQYETLLNEDLELEELKEQITEIERMFLQDDISGKNIGSKVDNVSGLIREKIHDVRRNEFRRERDRITNVLGTLSLTDDRMDRYQEMFGEMATVLDSASEDEYRNKMDSIRAEVDEEISTYFRENYDVWAKDVQKSLEELKSKDIAVDGLQSRIDKAGRLYRERDYLGSGEILRSMRVEINSMENTLLVKSAEEEIDSAEFLFEEAIRSGVGIDNKKAELKRAKELLNKGEVMEASRLAKQLENDIRTTWMDTRKTRLRDDLDQLKDVLTESDKLGLDISEISTMVEEAESLFDEDRFDEVGEFVNKAKETMDSERNQYYSEGAMDSIKKLKAEIGSLDEMGINTLEAETMLIEAERLFMNEEYEAAYSITLDIKEQINDSREIYFKDQIPREMDDVQKRVGRLEVMGLDTDAAREYLAKASALRRDGDLRGTMDSLKKAREVSEEIFKGHISLTIPETLVDVKKQVTTAEVDGLELDDINEMLFDAESLFKNEEYDQAMSTIEKAQDQFNTRKEDFFKSRYETNLGSVESILETAQGMDTEVDLSKSNINMARDAFERGDYESSHKLMQKILKFLEQSMGDKETNKRREVVQTYYDEVRTLLLVAEGENIDIVEEKKLFTMAGDLMTKNEFDQAEHVLEGIKVSLSEKRMDMKKELIESTIQTSEILLQNMRDMGMDTSHETKLIRELKEALRRNDLDMCEEINRNLTRALQKNQGPVLVQKVQRGLAELRARVIDAHSHGIPVAAAQSMMSEANELFELGDIESCQGKIDQANEELIDRAREHYQVEFDRNLEEVQKLISELSEMGIPSEDEEGLILSARALYDEGEFEQATQLLEVAQVGANAKLDSFQSATAESYVAQIRNYLNDLASGGLDTEDLERIYQEAMDLHMAGENKGAVAKFSSILELGEELRVMSQVDKYRERYVKLDRTYQDLKSVGMKSSKKLAKELTAVGNIIESNTPDIEKLENMLEGLQSALEEKMAPHLKDLVKKHISDASKEYREVKEAGLDDERIPFKIKEAGELFRNGYLKEADGEALEIIDMIDDLRKSESGQALKVELSQVGQMLTRLKTLGSNVAVAENLLTRAEAALGDGRLENAEKLIKSVRQSIKDIIRRNMRETALETIEFTDAMIHYLLDNVSGITQKIRPAEEILDTARALFSEKKFKAAKAKGEEARAAVEKLELHNIDQFLYVFRSMQADEIKRDVSGRLEELRGKGIDTSKARTLFEKSMEHFSIDEFEKGRQMITLSRIMLAELDQQSLRDSAFDELNNAHVEILARKKDGANISAAYKTYNHAKEAFSMKEYKKSILLSKRASYQARKT
ncbi:MAG: hypothetical protein ACMUIE_08250 [Thermoplasmatota archaeon]